MFLHAIVQREFTDAAGQRGRKGAAATRHQLPPDPLGSLSGNSIQLADQGKPFLR
jgi:hypothetical protein